MNDHKWPLDDSNEVDPSCESSAVHYDTNFTSVRQTHSNGINAMGISAFLDLPEFSAEEIAQMVDYQNAGHFSDHWPNLAKTTFSIALSPFANYDYYRLPQTIALLKALAPYIHDIIFTSHISPFHTDAHLIQADPELLERHLHDMLYIQRETGITVSPLYNNIYVPNTLDSLKQFINSFRRLYDLGIRSATLPHTLWLKFGVLQQEFPELALKHTILREVKSAQDFWNLASAGFSLVHLDRRLMRNQKALAEIRQAQQKYQNRYGRKVLIAMVTNEGCRGDCPFFAEHYQHNMAVSYATNVSKYNEIVQQYSCQPSRYSDCANYFRDAFLPLIRDDLDQVMAYIDVIKLAGRGSSETILLEHVNSIVATRLMDTDVIDRFSDNIMFQTLSLYMNEQLPDAQLMALLDQWRGHIKHCAFQCWDCSLCNQLMLQLANVEGVQHHITQRLQHHAPPE